MRGLIHQKGGNSTYGNNRRFYWHNAKERGFYGNQHVKTVGLKTVGNGITKVSGSVGNLIDGYKISQVTYLTDTRWAIIRLEIQQILLEVGQVQHVVQG